MGPGTQLVRHGSPQVVERLQAYALELGLALEVVAPERPRYPDQTYLARLWTGEPFASLGTSERKGRKELDRLVRLGYAKSFAQKAMGVIAFLVWASKV